MFFDISWYLSDEYFDIVWGASGTRPKWTPQESIFWTAFSESARNEYQDVMLLLCTSGIYLINNNNLQQSRGMYTASKQRKAKTKTTIIEFTLSRNIRSLCNTMHSNERYVPITRASERKFSGRARRSIPGPQILLSPQALSGPMPLNHVLAAGYRSSFKSEGITIFAYS